MNPARLALALTLLAPALAFGRPEGADTLESPPEAPPLHLVAPADLTTGFERDGRVEAAAARRVLLDLEEFRGRLPVVEVHPALRAGGRVEQGAVLLRIDPAPLERELRSAREALAEAALALKHAEAEGAVEAAAAADALQQAEAEARDAARALERFQSLDGPMMLVGAALGLASHQHYVDDQREELEQLEGIYKGTELAPETKEIVLERARRNLRHAEAGLEQQKAARTVTTDWEHPDRLRDLQERARWSASALAQTRERTRVGAERRVAALARARQAARDAEETVVRLEADLGRLTVAAPCAGALEAADLRPGDLLGAGQQVTEVHEGAGLLVRFEAREEDLRLVGPERRVKLALVAFPEVTRLEGVVAALHEVPTAGTGDEPTYTTLVRIEGTHPLLRVGLRARVTATGERVQRALAVPRKAVSVEDGRTFCRVWANDRETPVEVILGPGNREQVQVLRGLVAGDAVVLPEGR